MNRFEFLAARRVRAEATPSDAGAGGAHPAPSADPLAEVRVALERLRADADPRMRDAATIALARLGGDPSERERLRRTLVATIEEDATTPAARAAALALEYVAESESAPFLSRAASRADWPCAVRRALVLSLPGLTDLPGVYHRTLESALDEKQKGCTVHVAMAALLALRSSTAASARPTLERILADRAEIPEVRVLAATALAQGGLAGVRVLLASAEDREVDVRRAVVLGLGVLGWAPRAEDAIARIRNRYPHDVPLPAAEADSVRALEGVAALERKAMEAPLHAVVKHLATTLEADNDAFVRGMAAISLGRIARETQAPLALRALSRDLSRGDQREYDLLALGLAADPTCLEVATRFLRDPKARPTTRGAAAIALGLTADPRGRAPLREAVREETHPTVRGYAALALGMLGDADSRPWLREMVKRGRTDRGVAYASLGLALVGTRSDADVLVARLANTHDALLAPNLVQALRLLDERASVDLLVGLANTPGAKGRTWAAVALGYVAGDRERVARRMTLVRGFNYLVPGADALTEYFFGT